MVRKTSSKNSPKDKRDKLLNKVKNLDITFRIEELEKLNLLLGQKIKHENIDYEYFKIKPKYSTKFQAFIPISTGCDKFCTYCIVPYSRG